MSVVNPFGAQEETCPRPKYYQDQVNAERSSAMENVAILRTIKPILVSVVIVAVLFSASLAVAANYNIRSGSSIVVIHVSRAGIARALGHDHLISTRQVTGTARYVASDPARSQLELRLPVNALVVDDPELRREAGGRYAKPVSESARNGTRKNMLSERVLDITSFHSIEVQGSWYSGTAKNGLLLATISLRGVRREMKVPVRIEDKAGKLTASGKFLLRQSDFAITPFTTLGGTLAVADTIEIEYEFVLIPV